MSILSQLILTFCCPPFRLSVTCHSTATVVKRVKNKLQKLDNEQTRFSNVSMKSFSNHARYHQCSTNVICKFFCCNKNFSVNEPNLHAAALFLAASYLWFILVPWNRWPCHVNNFFFVWKFFCANFPRFFLPHQIFLHFFFALGIFLWACVFFPWKKNARNLVSLNPFHTLRGLEALTR